jgi:hypothetical protein
MCEILAGPAEELGRDDQAGRIVIGPVGDGERVPDRA